jgi:hypothetical protein
MEGMELLRQGNELEADRKILETEAAVKVSVVSSKLLSVHTSNTVWIKGT